MACCRHELVILTAEDTDPLLLAASDEVPVPNPYSDAPTTRVLRHRDNGDCVFLGEHGCTIYEHRPAMCRVFSCVGFVKRMLTKMSASRLRRAIRDGEFDADVCNAGMARLGDAQARRRAAP